MKTFIYKINKIPSGVVSRRNLYQNQFLVDEARADLLIVVDLVDDVCKHVSHRKDCDLLSVLLRV